MNTKENKTANKRTKKTPKQKQKQKTKPKREKIKKKHTIFPVMLETPINPNTHTTQKTIIPLSNTYITITETNLPLSKPP